MVGRGAAILLLAALAITSAVAVVAVAAGDRYTTGLTQIRYANAYCESGGDPHNARNSKYRGKWQFDQWTWNRFAPDWLIGRDPAFVPEKWQDWVAWRVTYDAWPNC